MDKAAFVILHYGEANTTDLCLSSIRQIEGWEKTEVIVVDNNVKKTEPEREIQKKHFETAPNIHVLQNHGQGGFSEANNLGYAYAREQECSFILVINNDITFPQRDFLERMYHSYESNSCHVLAPDVIRASTGEHQNPMDSRIRTAKEAEYTIRMNKLSLRFYPVAYPLLARWEIKQNEATLKAKSEKTDYYQMPHEDIVPFGACLIFTPSFVTTEEKAFQPETHFFYEEYILTLRCQKQGYLTRYDPGLKVLHESGSATRAFYKTDRKRMKFQLERTMNAAEVYLAFLRQAR